VSGGKGKLLTPGDFEIEHPVLTADRSAVLYASNQDDIDRRHIWRVSVSGGPPVAITKSMGLEWAPTPLDGSSLALIRSSATEAARPAMMTGGASPRDIGADLIPRDFPSASLVTPEQVIFPAADGLPIHGQLFLPKGMPAGERRPAVLFFHGGPIRQMLLGFHYMFYYHNAYAMNQYLASKGFIVMSVNYRSGIGYGHDFREARNYGSAGASEFADVQGAALYLRGRADVDPKQIGLWGGSYGGYLTALGLARASDLFAAGVDLHGVHDWSQFLHLPEITDKQRAAKKLAWESSPMASVDKWKSPVLLIHGDDDRNVPFSETVTLVGKLRARGVDVETFTLPDEVHDFLLHRSWLAVYGRTAEYFERKLRR
jgi:dipeptidyl aminopeptidase/acylaminoacyl peptidase